MHKHTPGPWCIGSQVVGDGFNLYSDSEKKVVAWIAPRTDGEYEGERYTIPEDMHEHPDAHLIAAAPDLLEALQTLEMALAGGIVWEDCDSMESTITKARLFAIEAIAKAQGEGK